TILYEPLFNALILLYKYIPGHDFGIAVIILTILIKFLFYPLGVNMIKSQKALSELQPKIKEIQEKYKNDKEKQVKETMDLYKKEKTNPFSGCLPLLIQFPVLIALFWVFKAFEGGLGPEEFKSLYSFVSCSGINTTFLGIIDLVEPSIFIAILAGIGQFFQVKMTSMKATLTKGKSSEFSNIMQKQMQYLLPGFTVFILFSLPSAIGLYWLVTTLFTILQQYFILKKSDISGAEK
ncbi:MAG: YidC/Oxa1 family membrane protein insertase, partial [Patescibacteria group bacterium]|nr:YidC/Oxa1 family membrane protein insertase [Patescibacteria group bacterium]